MSKKIILTGDRPTGRLHIGHFVGSLRRRVELQESGLFDKIFIMIADAQALTDNADNPEKVRQNIIEVALDYLSCGLDPAKSTIFIQSQVSELTELTFFYNNLVTVQRLQRNPTVKAEIQMRGFSDSDEGDNKAGTPVGFFCYPISQAADITGSGLLTEGLSNPRVVSIPLAGKTRVRIGWIVPKNSKLSPQAEQFVGLLEHSVADSIRFTESMHQSLGKSFENTNP